MKYSIFAIFLLWSGVAYSEPSEVVLQTIAMESANQSDDGMYLVAQVIVNRANRQNKTLEHVVLARKQFSCWNDRKWAKEWLGSHFSKTTLERARNALKRAIIEQNGKFKHLSHYHHTDIKPHWAKGHAPALIVGHHAFYEGIL